MDTIDFTTSKGTIIAYILLACYIVVSSYKLYKRIADEIDKKNKERDAVNNTNNTNDNNTSTEVALVVGAGVALIGAACLILKSMDEDKDGYRTIKDEYRSSSNQTVLIWILF